MQKGGIILISINNYLQNKNEEFGEENTNRLVNLYEDVPNERLKNVFSKIHYEINYLLKYLNERLQNGHYTADESRRLIYWIDQIVEIQSNLKKTDLAFIINSYYENIFKNCNEFLQRSGGSHIPEEFKKVELILIEPIFRVEQTIVMVSGKGEVSYPITLIGSGSYAQVFKYKDENYNKHFVIKRAKRDLIEKEKYRFKLEYEEMKKLNSPYVVEVYRFDEEKLEYIMEYVDETLFKYITTNNAKLTKGERQNIVYQILKAFEYIHSRNLLHRDISLTNVLVKKYEGLNVVKIADFGLVKTPDSSLTSIYTELKGSLNDPELDVYGFKNYNMTHETYALTRLIYFVMTGRTKMEKFDNQHLKLFVERGLNKNLNNRYQNISDLKSAYKKI
jgi:tRNA A-37 threonylcarbamoyl transferase component Bud32